MKDLISPFLIHLRNRLKREGEQGTVGQEFFLYQSRPRTRKVYYVNLTAPVIPAWSEDKVVMCGQGFLGRCCSFRVFRRDYKLIYVTIEFLPFSSIAP